MTLIWRDTADGSELRTIENRLVLCLYRNRNAWIVQALGQRARYDTRWKLKTVKGHAMSFLRRVLDDVASAQIIQG